MALLFACDCHWGRAGQRHVRPHDMDAESIALYSLLVASGFGGAYLTSLICRRSHRALAWHWAAVGALASGALAAVLFWIALSLPHGELGKGTTVFALAWGWIFPRASGCALVPAVLALLYYRRRFRNAERMV